MINLGSRVTLLLIPQGSNNFQISINQNEINDRIEFVPSSAFDILDQSSVKVLDATLNSVVNGKVIISYNNVKPSGGSMEMVINNLDTNLGLSRIYAGVGYSTSAGIVYFVPLDINSYNVWDGTKTVIPTTPIGTCAQFWTTLSPYSAINSPSGKCLLGEGALTKSDIGCVFTDKDQALTKYFYRYCGPSESCANGCMGQCNSGEICGYDYKPKDLKARIVCDPRYPNPLTFWQKYGLYMIIAIAVLILIIIIIIIVIVAKNSKKRKMLQSVSN